MESDPAIDYSFDPSELIQSSVHNLREVKPTAVLRGTKFYPKTFRA